jgi:hypothetical protein
MRDLSSVYAYRLEHGMLTPVCVPVARDATGILSAWVADLSSDRHGRTIAGEAHEDAPIGTAVWYTDLAITRAVRKSRVPVALGRPFPVKSARLAQELARLTPSTLSALVLADWRVAQHDAKKEGYTLKALWTALRAQYAQL